MVVGVDMIRHSERGDVVLIATFGDKIGGFVAPTRLLDLFKITWQSDTKSPFGITCEIECRTVGGAKLYSVIG